MGFCCFLYTRSPVYKIKAHLVRDAFGGTLISSKGNCDVHDSHFNGTHPLHVKRNLLTCFITLLLCIGMTGCGNSAHGPSGPPTEDRSTPTNTVYNFAQTAVRLHAVLKQQSAPADRSTIEKAVGTNNLPSPALFFENAEAAYNTVATFHLNRITKAEFARVHDGENKTSVEVVVTPEQGEQAVVEFAVTKTGNNWLITNATNASGRLKGMKE